MPRCHSDQKPSRAHAARHGVGRALSQPVAAGRAERDAGMDPERRRHLELLVLPLVTTVRMRRLPRRLHWVLWLLDDLDEGASLDR